MGSRHAGMPMLAGLARVFEWLEAVFSIIAGPLIIVSGLAAPFALFTRLQVFEQPALMDVYAIAMAAGLDIWLVVASGFLMQALIARRWIVGGLWAVLMLLLAAVGVQANWVVGYASSQGISNDAAMAQVGISPMLWTLERAVLVPFLVIVSTLIRRYVAELEHAHQPAPAAVVPAAEAEPAVRTPAPVLQLAPASLTYTVDPPAQKPKRAPFVSREAEARAAWRPGMSINELEAAVTPPLSHATAMRYHKLFSAEGVSESA